VIYGPNQYIKQCQIYPSGFYFRRNKVEVSVEERIWEVSIL